MQYSVILLDDFIAPHLSSLTACALPDVPRLAAYDHMLAIAAVFGRRYKSRHQAILLSNFIRRLGASIQDYRDGREALMRYIAALPQHDELLSHRAALSRFESCVVQLHTALVCLFEFVGMLAPPKQKVPNGSDYDRLRLINNRIKHFDEDVREAVKAGADVPLVPVWITDGALESTVARLTFVELAGILVDQSADAKAFVDPVLS